MSKKIITIVALALVLALFAGTWITVDAFAQDHNLRDRLRAAKRGLGQVTEITEQQFTVQNLQGQELTFLVDENTKFRSRSQDELSLDDLQVGRWVIVAAPPDENGERVARLVVVLPDEFDPSQRSGKVGSISAVALDELTFSLMDKQGELTTYQVDDDTRFSGGVQDLSELESGMRAWVAAQQQDDGSLLAFMVRANFPLEKYRGEILDVDLTGNSFTLHTRRSDQDLVFQVDQNTKFKGKGEALENFQDLQPGMLAVVVSRPGSTESEQLVAQWVGALEKDQLPDFDLRVIGEVISVQQDQLIVQSRAEEQYTFQLTAETRWIGKNQQVGGPEDLQPGMSVMVGALEISDGVYQAQVVAGFRPRF